MNWEGNLEHLEIVANKNMLVMVLVNPNNAWGVVYNHEPLAKVVEMENKLGLSIISEGVYELKLFPVAGTFPPCSFEIEIMALPGGWYLLSMQL